MYITNGNYTTKQNMILSPDPWIDTSTGEFRRAGRERKADEQELAEQGITVTEKTPIKLEIPYYDINEIYTARENALKQSIETSLGKLVEVVLVKTGGSNALNWYNAGYYPETGDTMNYNIVDVCGWGPDFGDPQTYLDTMLPQAGGMAKNIGLY